MATLKTCLFLFAHTPHPPILSLPAPQPSFGKRLDHLKEHTEEKCISADKD